MEPPAKPDESACCGSGCNPCIFEVYEKQLCKYRQQQFKNHQIEQEPQQNCISEISYTLFEVTSIMEHRKDVFFYTFTLHNASKSKDNFAPLVYNPGQHLLLKGCDDSGENYFTRAYTPIPHEKNITMTTNNDVTSPSFTILVRLYENGKMSNFLRNLTIGSETLWRGPYGDFQIDYFSQYSLFVAQGTGIAPIFAVIKDILANDECETFLKLFYCCRGCNEILLRDELLELKAHWNFTCEIFLGESCNDCNVLDAKYGEILYNRRLRDSDFGAYFAMKNVLECRVLICGSENFGTDIFRCTIKYNVDPKNIHLF